MASSRSRILLPAIAILFLADQAMAEMPQTNYLGTVIGKNDDRRTMTVQTDSYQWCCGGDVWEPCTYVFEADTPNQDAFDDVMIGDDVELSALGTPGEIGNVWVSVARLTSRAALLAEGLYGDPRYLVSGLQGGYRVVYTNVADCDACTNGGRESPCMCPAVATDVTISGGAGELRTCRLVPGENCAYAAGGDHIDTMFHRGELHAYPTCTNEPCAGPQAISNFTVRLLRTAAPFIRGDANADGQNLNISDGVYILQYLFINGPPPPCEDAADANDDGQINLGDGVYILQYLFASGTALPPPAAACGLDSTDDELTCASFPPCP